jgi:hypothetical protein
MEEANKLRGSGRRVFRRRLFSPGFQVDRPLCSLLATCLIQQRRIRAAPVKSAHPIETSWFLHNANRWLIRPIAAGCSHFQGDPTVSRCVLSQQRQKARRLRCSFPPTTYTLLTCLLGISPPDPPAFSQVVNAGRDYLLPVPPLP